TSFYTARGVELQRRFFDRFLKGDAQAWPDEPRVRLRVQRVDGTFLHRDEPEWPLARTRWTRVELGPAPTFDALGEGVEFPLAPVEEETELTGPASARLSISSTTGDADLFLTLRVYARAGEEVVFQGSNDPRTTLGKGWLRASHRRLDPGLSTEYRPYHPHDCV